MKKEIVPDSCMCNGYVCAKNLVEPEAIFTKGEVCPKNNVKVAGTSMCGSARDICKPCPQLIAKNLVPCKLGTVVKSSDCNGCDVHICQAPTVSGPPCPSGYYKFDSKNNQLFCDTKHKENQEISKSANNGLNIYGALWHRFWWYDSKARSNIWPTEEKDVLGHPYGSCMNNTAHCFGRLPEYLRQDSTSLLAIDGKGNAYKWKFVASNPTSNVVWRAFHDHVETPRGAINIRDNKIWNPQVMAGSRFKQNQDSFFYQDQFGFKSVMLDDNNDYCYSTLEIGPNGVDNLYDSYCTSSSQANPSNSLSLYFSEE